MDKEFIAEAYSLIVQIEELIKKYDYEDRVMSSILIGVIDADLSSEPKDGDEVQLKSIFSYNLDSAEELEMMKDIMTMQYQDPDIDELLGDLGISLN